MRSHMSLQAAMVVALALKTVLLPVTMILDPPPMDTPQDVIVTDLSKMTVAPLATRMVLLLQVTPLGKLLDIR